jgi:uncharacterized membrane protein
VSLGTWLHILRVIHVYAAIVLVGEIIMNTTVLMPALKRIPPAHSAVVSGKIGYGLMTEGGSAVVLLGITGFVRTYLKGQLPRLFSGAVLTNSYMRWLAVMAIAWLGLAITATISNIWYTRVLTLKLPYSAGLRDLEERRAAQERISRWQDRLAYVNLTLALLAALGGAMVGF